MRLLALTLAFAVLAACSGNADVVTRTPGEASIGALNGERRGAHEDARSTVGDEPRDEDSSGETDDSPDDSDFELVAVLPDALPFAFMLGSVQRWTRTHARPNDDPDPADRHRPPISA